MPIQISGLQQKEKDCYAYSHELGLILRSNGEEEVSIITAANTIVRAGFNAPTAAPTAANGAAVGLTANKFAIYKYVYAAAGTYLGISGGSTIHNSNGPRSNPSPQLATQVNGAGNSKVVTVTKTTDIGVDEIWLFRTALADTADLAQLSADAGSLYYAGFALNNGVAGTITIEDSTATISGNPIIELDNFEAPQFRFCVFDGIYFWGFANQPYILDAAWNDATGVVTVVPPNYFYNGREGQVIRLEGVTTGGFNGAGSFRFHYLTPTTGRVYLTDPTVAAVIPSSATNLGTGTIIINDNPNTLYRSKPNNPFAWGHVVNIAGVYVPELWQHEVGSGGHGTAIAIVPDQPLLKVDMEFPAACETFNLQAASTDRFVDTQRSLSRVYSASNHFAQFHAVNNGSNVLWALDFKNYAIIQSDGGTQQPVQTPLNVLLHALTRSRTKQLLAHGVYDSRSECNCIWVATKSSQFYTDICIYQHWPSGYWGIFSDYDILCSAVIEDILTSQRKIYVGTETGIIAEAFVEDRYSNYLPTTGLFSGTVASATATTIVKSDVANFNIVDNGMVGNYVIVTDANGLNAQIGIITGVTATTLTLNAVYSLSPVPSAGWKFYVGMIECELLKYFNFGLPQADKYMPEFWATMEFVDAQKVPKVFFYPERATAPTASYQLIRDKQTDAYNIKTGLPTGKNKTFGIGVVDRSYNAFQISDITLQLGNKPDLGNG